MKYGVYKCVSDNGDIVYVGSSKLSLSKLEWNHRNYFRFEDGYKSKFRDRLNSEGEAWTFHWVVEPYECSQKEIETKEKYYIEQLNPLFNVDKDPVKSSINYGRYK